ncbi:hypothetical protein QVD99_004706 [Batrachochytrium dendrobatidis]|nr:hypothetical protein QVD99_004706 [Batrachochytrium dendrobatidis]
MSRMLTRLVCGASALRRSNVIQTLQSITTVYTQRMAFTTMKEVPEVAHVIQSHPANDPSTMKSALTSINPSKDILAVKEPISSLVKHLIDSIKINGPISTAQFMRQALIHPLGGYYMKGKVFGPHGDFITSPEINQMFGELMAIWFMNHWQTVVASKSTPTGAFQYQSIPSTAPQKPFNIIELGPGRGTLMADMLTTLTQLKTSTINPLNAVHLVEASPELRKTQAQMLNCTMDPLENSTYRPGDGTTVTGTTSQGVKVYWHDTFDCIPVDETVASFIIAHEFFDAMPVYKFQKTEQGWREIMVDLDETPTLPYNFRFICAPSATKASVALMQPTVTDRFANVQIGERIELAPDVVGVSKAIAERVANDGGIALFVDYGRDHVIDDSLRGIRNHKIVHPLSMPGDCDLSADVDFSAIQHAVKGIANAYGPVPQGLFLEKMGIGARSMALIQGATDNKTKAAVVAAYERLVDPDAMGQAYKIMAITSSTTVPYALEPFQHHTEPSVDDEPFNPHK